MTKASFCLLQSKCKEPDARLVFLCQGKDLDLLTPILSQVSSDSVITVGKGCSIQITWGSEKRIVEYISSTPHRTIIEAAMKVFNITIPIDQLYLSTQKGERMLDTNQTIPFKGYPNSAYILCQK